MSHLSNNEYISQIEHVLAVLQLCIHHYCCALNRALYYLIITFKKKMEIK